jgi:hypothetical protein
MSIHPASDGFEISDRSCRPRPSLLRLAGPKAATIDAVLIFIHCINGIGSCHSAVAIVPREMPGDSRGAEEINHCAGFHRLRATLRVWSPIRVAGANMIARTCDRMHISGEAHCSGSALRVVRS